MPSTSTIDATAVDQQQTPLEAHQDTAEHANIVHGHTPAYFGLNYRNGANTNNTTCF